MLYSHRTHVESVFCCKQKSTITTTKQDKRRWKRKKKKKTPNGYNVFEWKTLVFMFANDHRMTNKSPLSTELYNEKGNEMPSECHRQSHLIA